MHPLFIQKITLVVSGTWGAASALFRVALLGKRFVTGPGGDPDTRL